MPHAWTGGRQTRLLRERLDDMKDGGLVIIAAPRNPYRCPPGPYERACLIANYLKHEKPKSKLIMLDANPDYVSKKPLFSRVYAEDYKGIVDYRVNSAVNEVDVAGKTFVLELGEKIKGDVLNLIPPQRAANIARDTGLITANNRWCEVDFRSMESVRGKGVHVLGDAIQVAPAMPKSGHMANNHGKVAAAAILRQLAGQEPNPAPVMVNTCYSFITDKDVVHVASVHQWDADKKTVVPVPNSGGLSPAMNEMEGSFANAWAQNIWADMLA